MAKSSSDEYIDNQLKDPSVEKELKTLQEVEKLKKESKDVINDRVLRLLLRAGFYGAAISAVAYIIITFVMITGVSGGFSLQKQLLFSIIGAVDGLLISFLLRNQGMIYAKQNEEARAVLREYKNTKNKTKSLRQLRTIGWWLVLYTLLDIVIKGGMVAATTFLTIYIFSEGSGNWALMGLALTNILMFVGFGLVGLSSFYTKYLEDHIPILKERIKKINERIEKKEKEESEKTNEETI